jgi:oxygen-independent coproporphyrinogen-3 oxidase
MPVSAMPPEAAPAGLAVYVHWPYCLAKCPYCDFNSHIAERIDQVPWRRAYAREIAHWAALAPGREVASIFFGGGTPSLMQAATVAAVLDAIAGAWPLAADVEVTLEANPTSVEAARFRDFRSAGVNRVSIGVQALDDDALLALGRRHSAAEAMATVQLAAQIFARFSFDLIYARPGQTPAAWRAELGQALDRAGEHLSLYQLTIEAGTPFHVAARQGLLVLPEDEAQAAMFEDTQAMTAAAGLPAYEISNHARPGAESRHNLVYWRGGDYAGIGPGAHGRLTREGRREATAAHRRPERWLAAVAEAGHGLAEQAAVTPAEAARERLLMGLRLAEGVALAGFGTGAVAALGAVVDAAALDELIDAGLLLRSPGRLAATATGRQVLNALLARLLRP